MVGDLEKDSETYLRGGLTREERRADRRRRVMDAAIELFGTRGYAAVPVDRICRMAGISTKSFYPMFDNKEELFIEVYDELVSSIAQAVMSAQVEGETLEESVRLRLLALVHAVVDDQRVAKIVVTESAGLSPRVEERRRAVHTALADFVVGTTAQFIDVGDLPAREYRRAALGLVGAVNELIVDFVVDPQGDTIDELVLDIRELFLAVRRGLTELSH